MIDHDEFRTAMLREFPEAEKYVADEINDGLLHLEMGSFRRYTQSLIDAGEFARVSAVFAFVQNVADQAQPDVLNAVYVSFLENFDFDATENDRTAGALLPPGLGRMLAELEDHWERISRRQAERRGSSQPGAQADGEDAAAQP